MGAPKTIDSIAAEVKAHALSLGIDATGKFEKRKNVWFFEITNGTEFKWKSLGSIKRAKNHFNRSNLDEQKEEVTQIAAKLNLTFTGNVTGASNGRKFELTDGTDFRWSALGNLRANKNPFRVATLDQQANEAQEYAKALGLTCTGNSKMVGGSRKYEVTDGSPTLRWITKEHLKSGKSPFTLLNLSEQQDLVSKLSIQMGFLATGNDNGLSSNRRRFEVSDGVRTRLTSLNRLQNNINPFLVPTLEEQKELATRLAIEIELSFTGKTRRNSGHNYFEVTDGKDFRWITLGGLRNQNNPFKESGFDVTKKGVFYLLKIAVNDEVFVGYGISNNAKGRFTAHNYELAKIGGKILETMIYSFPLGRDANDLETRVKRAMPKVNLGVKGFQTECTSQDQLETIIEMAEFAHSNMSSFPQ